MLKKNQAFTFIELLVTLAIIMMVTLLTVPNLKSILLKHRLNALAQHYLSLIQYTRSSAIQSGHIVSLCGTSQGVHCDNRWDQRVMVFIDNNHNARVDSDDLVLRMQHFSTKGITVSWRAFPSSNVFEVLPSGVSQEQNGSFRFTSTGKTPLIKSIKISKSGRARME